MKRQVGETDAVERGTDVVEPLGRQAEKVLVDGELTGARRQQDHLGAGALDVTVLLRQTCNRARSTHDVDLVDGIEGEIDCLEDVAVVRS